MKSFVPAILAALIISSCQANNSPPAPIDTSTSPLTETKAAPTTTSTPLPTETPVPKLSLDPSKPFGVWVGSEFTLDSEVASAFTAEQQAWLIEVMQNPWGASKEARDFYNKLWAQGAANLTGDPSFLAPLPEVTATAAEPELLSQQEQARQDEASRRMRIFDDYLWNKGNSTTPKSHSVNAPLPFDLLNASQGDPRNFPLSNEKAPKAEGHDSSQ